MRGLLSWKSGTQRSDLLRRKPRAHVHTQACWTFVGRRASVSVYAGRKGDGKQNRKKKSGEQEEKVVPPPPASEPLRLLPGQGIRVKHIKLYKEIVRKASLPTPSPAKAYRREHKSTEEYREEKIQREQEAVELSKRESKNFALSQLHNTMHDDMRMKVLLVDGYNVIGHRLNKNQANGSTGLLEPGQVLEEEREKLIEDLCLYSQHAGVRVVVAFDALDGPTEFTTETTRTNGVTVVFCGDKEADTYLSQAVSVWLEKGYNLIVVATDDQMVREGNEGRVFNHAKRGQQVVHCVKVGRLKQDMQLSKKDFHRKVDEMNSLPVRLGGGIINNAKTALGLLDLRAALPSRAAQGLQRQQQQRQRQGEGGG